VRQLGSLQTTAATMTPNPHRGSDFADFLAEEGLTPTNDLPCQLRGYNAWRRGNETLEQPSAAWVSTMLDATADRLEELEEQLAANHEAIKLMGKWLEDERALADRLANALVESMERLGVCAGHREALGQWKEARRE
jgi:uncharacterized coiled-coil protein SlyX